MNALRLWIIANNDDSRIASVRWSETTNKNVRVQSFCVCNEDRLTSFSGYPVWLTIIEHHDEVKEKLVRSSCCVHIFDIDGNVDIVDWDKLTDCEHYDPYPLWISLSETDNTTSLHVRSSLAEMLQMKYLIMILGNDQQSADNSEWCRCTQGQSKQSLALMRLPGKPIEPIRQTSTEVRVKALLSSNVLHDSYGLSKNITIEKVFEGWFECNLLIRSHDHFGDKHLWLKVADFTPATKPENMLARLEFQEHVVAKRVIPSSTVIRNQHGTLIVRIKCEGFDGLCYALDYLGPDYRDFTVLISHGTVAEDVEAYCRLFEILGKLHASTMDYEAPVTTTRILERWTRDTIDLDIGEQMNCAKMRIRCDWCDEKTNSDRIRMISVSLFAMLDACKMYGKDCPIGWCHADIHELNVMTTSNDPGRLVLIDYGDVIYSYYVTDLAFIIARAACFHRRRKSTTGKSYVKLINEYTKYRKLNEFERKVLYPYVLGILALSILEGMESYERETEKKHFRSVYIDRSYDSLQEFLFSEKTRNEIESYE